MGQLGDGGGLAHAVDADHEYHFGRIDGRNAPGRAKNVLQLGLEQLAHALGLGDLFLTGALFEALHQLQRRFIAQVGHDEELFQLFPEGFVQLTVPGKQRVQAAGQLFPRAAEAFADLHKQTVALVLLVLQVQGQSQTVLQLGAEFLHQPVVHAGKPALKIPHKGLGLGLRGVQGAQQKKQPLPEGLASFFHAFQHNAQPDRKTRLGLA